MDENGGTLDLGFCREAGMFVTADIFVRADGRGDRVCTHRRGSSFELWDCCDGGGWLPGSVRERREAAGGCPGGMRAGNANGSEVVEEMPRRDTRTIVVTDLTRMREGRRCLAGVDMQSLRDVRPIRGSRGLDPGDLEVTGGRIRLGCALEFEPAAAELELRRPHLEDIPFDPSHARILFRMRSREMHDFLTDVARPRLRDIYGPYLHGNWGLPGELERSLGTLACSRVRVRRNGWGRARIDLRTRGGDDVTDLPFSDSRIRAHLEAMADQAVLEERLGEINRALNLGGHPIVRTGLSRPFDPHGTGNPRCWLQVNAVYPGGAAAERFLRA